MNLLLLLAGLLALAAAGVHGLAGHLLVVRKLFEGPLPSTYFGGVGMTRAMVLASWHITSFAFFACGVGMVVAAALDGDSARAVGIFAAASFTGFAAVAGGFGVANDGSARALLRHPGPLALGATATLAWLGAL